MKVSVKVYGRDIPERELVREVKRIFEVRKIAKELYDLLLEEELDEIEREVSKRRLSFRKFEDID